MNKVLKWHLVGVAVIGVVVAALHFARRPTMPVRNVPDFLLTDQTGRPFGRPDLDGKIWVAGFVFTRCSGPCPLVSGRMAELRREFGGKDRFRLVSFSVDPGYDTPEVLAEYAKKWAEGGTNWAFLTGPQDRMHALIREGFLAAVEPNNQKGRPDGEAVSHSIALVLVDGRKGHRVAGRYNVTEENSIEQLRRDLAARL